MATTAYPWSVPQDHASYNAHNFRVENLAADPSGGGLWTGRIWLNTTSVLYKFYDGATVQTVGTGAGYTDEQAQDAVGAILTDTATLDLTYNDATPSITGTVLDSPTVAGTTPAQLRDRATHTGTQTASTVSDLAAVVQAYRLDQFAAPNIDLSLGTHKLTNVTNGTAATDAATFGQLNAIVQGQTWKDPVRLMTQSNDTLSGLAARDGVTPVAGDRVLVPNQTAHADDGIYVAAAGAWARATDADAAAELNNATVLVQGGTASGGDVYTQTATIVTLGTTDQVWVKSGEGNTVYLADGTTITLSGSTFSVAAAQIARIAALEAKFPAPFTINSGQTSPYTWNHALATYDIDVRCYYNDVDRENFGYIVERPDTNNLLIRFGATTTRPVRVLPSRF